MSETAKRYALITIYDMLTGPADRLPVLLAELPSLLDAAREVNEAFGPDALTLPIIWKDDDKGELMKRFSLQDDGGEKVATVTIVTPIHSRGEG
jgi:hypothetical protein